MKDYIIKQKINTCSIPPTIYSEHTMPASPCIYIAHKQGKYGIITADNSAIIPFIYDNISMAGFNLYLLIKNGKMGLAHIIPDYTEDCLPVEFREDTPSFKLLKIIPCEYDFIEVPENGESFAILRKDSETSSSLDIYFCRTCTVQKGFWREQYNDSDYIIVTDNDKMTHKLYDCNGEHLHTIPDSGLSFTELYESESGTILVNLKEDNSAEITLFEKEEVDELLFFIGEKADLYELTGKTKTVYVKHFVQPVFLEDRSYTSERPNVLGFIIDDGINFSILDDKLNKYSDAGFSNISIKTIIESETHDRFLHSRILHTTSV